MIRRSYELGKNIAVYRKKAGLTQTQLAEQLTEITGTHISIDMVSSWERAIVDVPAAIMPDICHCCHCTSFDLYPHSETLTDRDVRLIDTVNAMSEDDKDDLYYLLHTWNGDRKALLKLNVVHAVQDESKRYVPDRMIIDSYIDAIKRHDQGIDTRIKVDINYVLRAWRHLLESDEEE